MAAPLGQNMPDRTKVFVIHGRNQRAKEAMFQFLEALGLHPMDFDEAAQNIGHGAPLIGDVLTEAFQPAQAVVALFTPDDTGRLGRNYRPWERSQPQARQNVVFEAGMAFGRLADRTVLVKLGKMRLPSDVVGRKFVEISNERKSREELKKRLENAQCTIASKGDRWLTSGDFDACEKRPDGWLWHAALSMLMLLMIATAGLAGHSLWLQEPPKTEPTTLISGTITPQHPGIMVGLIGDSLGTTRDHGHYEIPVPASKGISYTALIFDSTTHTTCTPSVSLDKVKEKVFDYDCTCTSNDCGTGNATISPSRRFDEERPKKK
jgi:hypothetical protein